MKQEKKVLVLVADAGFGHRSAADAIISALKEKHGEQVEITLVNPLNDKRAPLFLRDSQEEYDRIVKEIPRLYQFGFEASDRPVPAALIDSALAVLLFEVMWDLIRKVKPDVIVTTYPIYQVAVIQVLRTRRLQIPLVTVITDLISVHRVWFNPKVSACLVPTPEVAVLAKRYGIAEEKIKITGIPVHPAIVKEQRSKTEIRAALGWSPDLTTVLAVGSQRVKQMAEALNVLNHFGAPLQIIALAGGDDAEFRKLKAMDWHQTAQVFNFVENMPELMKASDVILCKAGGLITSEALACGVPMVLVDVIPGQETGNANYVTQHKAGEMAEDPLKVREVFSHWMKDDQAGLKKSTRNAVKLGKPLAAYHAANVIWKQLNIKCDPLPKKDEVIERLHHVESLKSTIQRIHQLGQ